MRSRFCRTLPADSLCSCVLPTLPPGQCGGSGPTAKMRPAPPGQPVSPPGPLRNPVRGERILPRNAPQRLPHRSWRWCRRRGRSWRSRIVSTGSPSASGKMPRAASTDSADRPPCSIARHGRAMASAVARKTPPGTPHSPHSPWPARTPALMAESCRYRQECAGRRGYHRIEDASGQAPPRPRPRRLSLERRPPVDEPGNGLRFAGGRADCRH